MIDLVKRYGSWVRRPAAPAETGSVATIDAEELSAFTKLYGYVRSSIPAARPRPRTGTSSRSS